MLRWIPAEKRNGPSGSPCCTPLVDLMTQVLVSENPEWQRENSTHLPMLGKSAQTLSKIAARLMVLNALETSICSIPESGSATHMSWAQRVDDVGHCVFHADAHLSGWEEFLGLRKNLFERQLGDEPAQDFPHGDGPDTIIFLLERKKAR